MTELVARAEQYDRDIPGTWDPNDSWGTPDQQYTLVGVYVQVRRKLDEYSTHELDDVKRGDEVYVVTVNYDSGSSFHRSYGHTYILAIYKTMAEALSLEGQLTHNPASYDGYSPWDGYFERLNHFDVHTVRVD